MNFLNLKIGPRQRAKVVSKPGILPGLKGSVKIAGGTDLPGQPSILDMQKYSGSFALARPETLVGYTGGWTYGHANLPGNIPARGITEFGVKG